VALSWGAGLAGKWTACAALGLSGLVILARAVRECAAAVAIFLVLVREIERSEKIQLNTADHAQRTA
jgi:hypothetical protein